MIQQKKRFRYYYWLIREFIKKNARLILLSFFLSIISIVSITSLTPYLINFLNTDKEIIGMVGKYDFSSIPDQILYKISNGLIFVNDKGQVSPILIDNWETLNGGKEYRFHLKPNLVWNNGDIFSAKEISYQFKDVEITAPDDLTIDFKLKNKLPIFPSYLSQPIIKSPLVGIGGLYRVDNFKFQYGQLAELTLSPNKTNLPVITYKFYDTETKMINAYKIGEIKEMTVYKKSIADVFTNWKNTKVTKNVDYSRLLTLFFNMNNPLFKDKKDIRQAIAMSINKEDFKDEGELATGPIPPTSWANSTDLKDISYNPDFATKVIKKNSDAGQSIEIDTYDEYLDLADKIAQSIKNSGVNVSTNILYDKPTNFGLLLAYWKVPADPDQYYFWHSSQSQGNITGYKNVKVDKLLEDGRNISDIDARKKIYHDFQKVIVDDVPAYFLYYPYIFTISRK